MVQGAGLGLGCYRVRTTDLDSLLLSLETLSTVTKTSLSSRTKQKEVCLAFKILR